MGTGMVRLDHVNIHTRDPDRMHQFLASLLGVREGHRPPFASSGHWLYLGDVAVIHLNVIQYDKDFPQGIINHVAFALFDFDAAQAAVKACGYPFEYSAMPGTGVRQFFVTGPEGVRIELQCRPAIVSKQSDRVEER